MRVRFPSIPIPFANKYFDQYTIELSEALRSINSSAFDKAAAVIEETLENDKTIFSCGNGGSAAIANHLVCDYQKGINSNTKFRPKVVGLASNVELITAVSNDMSYKEVFAMPLQIHGRPGDLLIAISSSGSSENIVSALNSARALGMKSIALTGFDGGRCRDIADISIHVEHWNYGIVEDAHQVCMHSLAQFIRLKGTREDAIAECRL